MSQAQMHHPVIRLLRLHQPTGIWLLMWPCLWSYSMAAGNEQKLWVIGLLALGAAMMRAAGCIINDMTDRELDKGVERTRLRPLASGEISLAGAGAVLIGLLSLALLIAIALGNNVLLWSACALPLVIVYPWMKRITWWPQLFLGITFNWGALVGWVAAAGSVSLPAWLLYAGGIFWTIGYDTIYAHQDRHDDELMGIKSTARLFHKHSYLALTLCYIAALCFWAAAAYFHGLNAIFFMLLSVVGMHFFYQIHKLDINNALVCQRLFKQNGWFGGLLWVAILIGSL